MDKLSDRPLYFLVTFYNELKWKCGIVPLSTHYFSKRPTDGPRNRRKGYGGLWSRCGAFVEPGPTTAAGIEMLCGAQGMEGPAVQVVAKNSMGDLRKASEPIRPWLMENGRGTDDR